eukprot:gene45651-56883_t
MLRTWPVKFHLNDQEGGKAQMRANIDAWWPLVEQGGVEAIVMNASGCGVTVKEYAHTLKDDAPYATKAERISALTRDLSELLPAMLPELAAKLQGRVDATRQPDTLYAYHPPCTLQHGQKLRGGVEAHLNQLGFKLRTARNEAHLCCGSAGTYSVLQPDLSHQLRDRKLGVLAEAFGEQPPDVILSANIGCITHLQSGTGTPVRHWVERWQGVRERDRERRQLAERISPPEPQIPPASGGWHSPTALPLSPEKPHNSPFRQALQAGSGVHQWHDGGTLTAMTESVPEVVAAHLPADAGAAHAGAASAGAAATAEPSVATTPEGAALAPTADHPGHADNAARATRDRGNRGRRHSKGRAGAGVGARGSGPPIGKRTDGDGGA